MNQLDINQYLRFPNHIIRARYQNDQAQQQNQLAALLNSAMQEELRGQVPQQRAYANAYRAAGRQGFQTPADVELANVMGTIGPEATKRQAIETESQDKRYGVDAQKRLAEQEEEFKRWAIQQKMSEADRQRLADIANSIISMPPSLSGNPMMDRAGSILTGMGVPESSSPDTSELNAINKTIESYRGQQSATTQDPAMGGANSFLANLFGPPAPLPPQQRQIPFGPAMAPQMGPAQTPAPQQIPMGPAQTPAPQPIGTSQGLDDFGANRRAELLNAWSSIFPGLDQGVMNSSVGGTSDGRILLDEAGAPIINPSTGQPLTISAIIGDRSGELMAQYGHLLSQWGLQPQQ